MRWSCRIRLFLHFFGNQLVGEDALLGLLRLQLRLLLVDFALSSLGLCRWPCISEVRVLSRVNRVILSSLRYLSAQGLQFSFASEVTALLRLKKRVLSRKLHQMALLVVNRQMRVTQSLLQLSDLLLGRLDRILHLVDTFDVVARDLCLLLPLDTLLLSAFVP